MEELGFPKGGGFIDEMLQYTPSALTYKQKNNYLTLFKKIN